MAQSSSRALVGESVEMHETSSLKDLEEIDEDFGFGDDLELNQFDGLPYSSRYYKLLKEKHQLPIWESRQEFMTVLETNQLVIISGTTKTGKSTQVRWLLNDSLRAKSEFCILVYCSYLHHVWANWWRSWNVQEHLVNALTFMQPITWQQTNAYNNTDTGQDLQ